MHGVHDLAGVDRPGGPEQHRHASVELGVKFSSDVDGQVTGIRFYKGTGDTGTRVGNRGPCRAGLATVTFTDERQPGGSRPTSPTPVPGTGGHRVRRLLPGPQRPLQRGQRVLTTGMDRAPLHALRDGVSGGNGVYAYGTTTSFPGGTCNSTSTGSTSPSPPARAAPSGAGRADGGHRDRR